MYRYRVIEIKNLEPLKIGSRGNQSTYSEPATEHIPGSTIRGAIIGEMIRLGLFNDTTKNSILLNMECYNAYICFNGITYLPKPSHLRIDKHKWRAEKIEGKKLVLELSDLLKENSAEKNQLEYSFVTIKDNKLFGKKVAKEYRLHHFKYKSDLENKEQENIFRYEAISPRQSFKAIIRYDQELEVQMETLFRQKLLLYLGGSKGSGYGKSQICATDPIDSIIDVKNKLCINYDKENKTKEVVITFFSDCLFRNEFGQPINYIPEKYFLNLKHKGIRLEKQFIQTGQTEGYNTTWSARYPKETTIKAGSVLKYVFEEELTENEMSVLINSLEKGLVGSRTQDGYGWLGVNIKYPEKINMVEESPVEDITINEGDARNQIDLRDFKENQVFDVILSGMGEAKERWLNTLYTLMINKENTDKIKENIIISNKLNKSQLKNMEDLIKQFLESGKIKIKNNTILDRFYTNDNNYFSLNEYNFKSICNFLNGEKNEELIRFAVNKLNSEQGKFFYFKECESKKISKFIAELLKRSLQIERMRGKQNEA